MYRKLLFTLGLVFIGSAPALADPPAGLHRQSLNISPLGRGAYVVTGGIANTGFVVGEQSIIAIDPQMFVKDAREQLAAMAGISPKPVSTMILTHSDMDHVFGLPGWPKNIKIIAQENTKADIKDVMAGKGPPTATPMPVPDGMETYLPTHLVRHHDEMEIDGVRIILTHLSAGHTNGDLLVYLPDHKVAFAGDLLTIGDPNLPNGGLYPVIHLEKHGSSLGWIKIMKAALELDANFFIGGHGPQPVGRGALEAAVAATEKRRSEIKKLFNEGRSLAEIKVELNDAPKTGPLAFFPTFIETTYRELLQE